MAFNFGLGGGGFGAPVAAPAAPTFGGFGAPAAGGFGAAAAPAAAPAGDADHAVQLPPGADSISMLGWSPNGQFLGASSWDSKVYIYEVARNQTGAPSASGKLVSPELGGPVLDFKWDPSGQAVYAAGCGKTVKLWNLSTNAVTDIGSHDAPVKTVHWSPTRNLLITGGWDKKLCYWDPRTNASVAKIDLPDRVFAMDVLDNAMVLCTADRKLHVFDLNANPSAPVRSIDSPLKLQTKCVRIFKDRKFFAVASVEGRCGIRVLDAAMDKAVDTQGRTFNFAFRCHRDATSIFPVNCIDTHPSTQQYDAVFATGGSDGAVSLWEREKRQKLKEIKNPAKMAVVDCKWNAGGDLLAYAASYDWSKGPEGYNPKEQTPVVFIRHTLPDKDFKLNVAK